MYNLVQLSRHTWGYTETSVHCGRAPLPPFTPHAPRGHVIKTPQHGVIQPPLSLASQAGVFLHLSNAALIYIPSATTPPSPFLLKHRH